MTDFTVKGGYWETWNAGVLTLTTNASPMKRKIARVLHLSAGLKGLRAIAIALDGVAPGATATRTHKQVQAVESPAAAGDVSGVRTIETVTDVNRATTAGDKTNIDGSIYAYPARPTYPANGDGNPRGVAGG